MYQYRLMAPIYTLEYIQNPLTDMDASITKVFAQYTNEKSIEYSQFIR